MSELATEKKLEALSSLRRSVGQSDLDRDVFVMGLGVRLRRWATRPNDAEITRAYEAAVAAGYMEKAR